MEEGIQYFNSQEAAKILSVNVSTIKRWTDEGKLNCIKTAGGHRKFLMEHLADFLEKNKKKTEKVNLFPVENRSDLKISHHILKGDFTKLTEYLVRQSILSNVNKIQQVLNGLYLSQYPLWQIYDYLLTPVLHKIGELWENGKVSVVEEHIASQAILDAVQRLQGIIKLPVKKTGKALCLNFSSELHSIALKMAAHILELRSFKVFFSGQITPLLKIENLLKSAKPARIYISGTMVNNLQKLQKEFDVICQQAQVFGSKMYVGGRAFDQLKIDHPVIVRRLLSFEDVNKF